jgi:hypothetical protein
MIKIKRGLDIPIEGAPRQVIEDAPRVRAAGLVGFDYVGMKPTMAVREGGIRLQQRGSFPPSIAVNGVFCNPSLSMSKATKPNHFKPVLSAISPVRRL